MPIVPDSPASTHRKHLGFLGCGAPVHAPLIQPPTADADARDAGEPEDAPIVNRAKKLGSETAYLRLSREEAVRELDTRLAEPEPPAITNVEKFLAAQMGVTEARSPHSSPVRVGVLDFFDNPFEVKAEVSWRLVEVGNKRLVVIMDAGALCEATEAAVHALAASFKAKLERELTEGG